MSYKHGVYFMKKEDKNRFFERLQKRQSQKENGLSNTRTIMLYKDFIKEALQDGYTKKEIWLVFLDDYKIKVSYPYFTTLLTKIVKETESDSSLLVNETSKNEPQTENKTKRKPIYNPPEEKKGFVHNPVARKDLW